MTTIQAARNTRTGRDAARPTPGCDPADGALDGHLRSRGATQPAVVASRHRGPAGSPPSRGRGRCRCRTCHGSGRRRRSRSRRRPIVSATTAGGGRSTGRTAGRPLRWRRPARPCRRTVRSRERSTSRGCTGASASRGASRSAAWRNPPHVDGAHLGPEHQQEPRRDARELSVTVREDEREQARTEPRHHTERDQQPEDTDGAHPGGQDRLGGTGPREQDPEDGQGTRSDAAQRRRRHPRRQRSCHRFRLA